MDYTCHISIGPTPCKLDHPNPEKSVPANDVILVSVASAESDPESVMVPDELPSKLERLHPNLDEPIPANAPFLVIVPPEKFPEDLVSFALKKRGDL